MKTLTAAQKTARDADGHSLARIIQFDWPDSGTIYYTERGESEIDPDSGKTFVPIVASFPQTARAVDMGVIDGGPFHHATFSIWIDPNDIQNIETRVDDENPTGALITTYQVLRPVSGSLDSAEWSTLGKYRIESWVVVYKESGNVVRFDCVDFSQQIGDKEIGRVITDDLYPAAPDRSFGLMIPIIFGEVENSPCPLVSTGARTSLDATLNDVDATIEVVSTADFDGTGTIQIDNEKISYSGKTADTFTGATRGIDGTTATAHAFGAAVIEVLSSYRFLLADAVTEPGKTITDATNATPIVVTAGTHGYENADPVFIEGVVGNTAANGFWLIANKTPTTFELVGSVGNGGYVSDPGDFSYRIDIKTFDNVRIKGVALDVTEYAFNVINDGEEHVGVVDVPTLPSISAAGFTTLQPLETLDPAISWAVGGSNTAGNPADAVDSGDDKHVTFADITEEEDLILLHDNDLSGNAGEIKSAKVFVEYQADQTGKDDWPAIAPTIRIFEGAVEKHSADMGEPADVDSSLFPSGTPGDDSTDSFVATSGANDLIGDLGVKYISGYGIDTVPSGGLCTFDLVSWPSNISTVAGENPIVGDPGSISCGVAVETCTLAFPFDTFTTRDLLMEPIFVQSGTKATQLRATIVVQGVIVAAAGGFIQVKLTAGGDTVGYTNFAQPSFGGQSTLVVELTGDYDTTDLQGARLFIRTFGDASTPNTRTSQMRVAVVSITLAAYGQSPILAGLTTPIDGIGLSSRVRQEIDITTTVRAAGGWDFFDGTDAGNRMGLQITYPNQTPDNNTILRVYDIGVEVEVLGGAGDTLITEDTAEMTADVSGYFGAVSAKISSKETITRLLEDSDFYGLTGADYDAVGLGNALNDATNGGAIDWRLDRRISQITTVRELLRQAVTDAGIRYTMDSGKFVFFPHLFANVSDIDTSDNYTLARLIMTSLPTKERTHIDLIRNQVAVYYRRAFTGEFGFARKREGDDALSQSQPWGVRRETYGAEWIRDNDVADALADRMVPDFAQNRVLMQLTTAAGRTLHHEVGDVIELDDDFSRLTFQAGRIVGAAYPSATLQRFTLAVTDRRIRLFNDSASGSYVDVWAGMQRVEIVVDGTKVAIISVDGLRLKGELLEEAFNPEVGQSAAIEYDSSGTNMIVVSVFPGAAYFRAMEFHVTGDARVYLADEEGTTFPTLSYSGDAEDYVFFAGTDLESPGALTRGFAQLIELLVGGEENATFQTREIYESAV